MSKYLETPDGWQSITQVLEEQLVDMGCTIVQMKEKFAELRVYYRPASQQAEQLIARSNKKCVTTCQVCGNPGTAVSKGGWIRIVCKAHE